MFYAKQHHYIFCLDELLASKKYEMWFEACEVHKKNPRLIDFSRGLFGRRIHVHKHQIRQTHSTLKLGKNSI